jgi:hypothetical protein
VGNALESGLPDRRLLGAVAIRQVSAATLAEGMWRFQTQAMLAGWQRNDITS